MTERIWDKFLTERDKAVFAAGGFGARAGFGKRPALLVIDVNRAFCGERPEPILESIKRWRTSCGEDAWVALDYIKALIDTARAKDAAGHLHHRGAALGQLGWRQLALEKHARRRGGRRPQRPRRRQRDRGNDSARPAGHRDPKAEAVGFFRDKPRLLSRRSSAAIASLSSGPRLRAACAPPRSTRSASITA